jgi:SPP1 gp7 family putative phage head morphogenesis protein
MSNLTSAFISHQIWLQRNASHEASLVEPFIDDMRKEVRSRVLQFGDDSRTRANLNALLRDLDSVLGGIAGDWNQLLLSDLKDLGVYESQWSAKTMAANIQASFTTPSPEQVWSAIKFNPMQLNDKPVDFMSWIDGWKDDEVSRLTQGVKMGFVQGRTTRDIVKEVVGAGGLADISERNAKTIVRTAVAHVSNVAREATYDKNSDVIEGYEWISTLDSKTSAICRGRDGMKFKADAEFRPKPPAHANCRSSTIPLVSSEFDFLDAGAKRAARGSDGGMQVDASTSYYDFLKSQPAAFQDAALGVTRGKIFRNAGMTPEEFRAASVDGFGNPLTLKQMAEMDDRVARYLDGKTF